MVDKYHSDTGERTEALSYTPSYQDSGDLEGATRTVTATARQGTPDYSVGLTVPAPDDSRIAVKRVGTRLQLTIDSMTAGHLYGSVHVNGVERKTFDLTGTGASYVVQDLTEGQFNVGSASSYEVFLWVNSGQAVVSVCQVWQAVGSTDTGYNLPFCLQIMHEGLAQVFAELNRVGTGNIEARIGQGGSARPCVYWVTGGAYANLLGPLMLCANHGLSMRVNNSGDLGYFVFPIRVFLRSER